MNESIVPQPLPGLAGLDFPQHNSHVHPTSPAPVGVVLGLVPAMAFSTNNRVYSDGADLEGMETMAARTISSTSALDSPGSGWGISAMASMNGKREAVSIDQQ